MYFLNSTTSQAKEKERKNKIYHHRTVLEYRLACSRIKILSLILTISFQAVQDEVGNWALVIGQRLDDKIGQSELVYRFLFLFLSAADEDVATAG